MKRLRIILTIFLLLFIYCYIVNITELKSNVVLLEGEKYKFNICPFIKVSETANVVSNNESNYKK